MTHRWLAKWLLSALAAGAPLLCGCGNSQTVDTKNVKSAEEMGAPGGDKKGGTSTDDMKKK